MLTNRKIPIIRVPIFIFFAAALVLSLRVSATADDNEIFGEAKHVEPNILIIFDNSRSMIDHPVKQGPRPWPTRMEVAKDTVKKIIDDYGEDYRFGIMLFNRNMSAGSSGGYIPNYAGREAGCAVKDTFVRNLEARDKVYDAAVADYKDYLKGLVDSIEARYRTPLAETLAEAGHYFAGENSLFNHGKRYESPVNYWCRKNYIILMTDGAPTRDNDLSTTYLNGKLAASGLYEEEIEFSGGMPLKTYYENGTPELEDVAGFLYNYDLHVHDQRQNIETYTIGFSEGVARKGQQLLQDTADRGIGAETFANVRYESGYAYEDNGGVFFYADTGDSLQQAFDDIMTNISVQVKDSIFAPASVPISEENKAYAGDYGYIAMFKPQPGEKRWIGNLKKYRLSGENEFFSCDGNTRVFTDGGINDSASSCWGRDHADCGTVDQGGAGEILSERPPAGRIIYTNTGDPASIEDLDSALLSKRISEDLNAEILKSNIFMKGQEWKLGDLNHSRPAVASYGKGEKYIFVGSNSGLLHCFDDSDGSEKWAFLPTQQFDRLDNVYSGGHPYFMDGSPTVANTGRGKKIVICGERRGGNHYYAMDITSIDEPKYLFTEHSSGQSWKNPQFIRVATKNFMNNPESSPSKEAFLLTGGYDEIYDTHDAEELPEEYVPVGNKVYAIGAVDGAEIFLFDDQETFLPMEHSIVSAFAADTVDDGRHLANRIYAGDLGGNMFAFRDDAPKATRVEEKPEDVAPQRTLEQRIDLNGDWQTRIHLFSVENPEGGFRAAGRKIFAEADFVREFMTYWDTEENQGEGGWRSVVGDWLFFGTGDRADPLCTDKTNYFYCVKNDWHTGNENPLTVNSTVSDFQVLGNKDPGNPVLVDVTRNMVQQGDDFRQQKVKAMLNAKYNRGWYIELEHEGEKCLSAPVVYSGVVYFTTFTTNQNGAGKTNPCENSGTGGTARLYALDYKTGAAVYNFHQDPSAPAPDKLTKADRFIELDTSLCRIPSSPQIPPTHRSPKLQHFPEDREIKDQGGFKVFYWKQKS